MNMILSDHVWMNMIYNEHVSMNMIYNEHVSMNMIFNEHVSMNMIFNEQFAVERRPTKIILDRASQVSLDAGQPQLLFPNCYLTFVCDENTYLYMINWKFLSACLFW